MHRMDAGTDTWYFRLGDFPVGNEISKMLKNVPLVEMHEPARQKRNTGTTYSYWMYLACGQATTTVGSSQFAMRVGRPHSIELTLSTNLQYSISMDGHSPKQAPKLPPSTTTTLTHSLLLLQPPLRTPATTVFTKK
jgi:hypothetical protein